MSCKQSECLWMVICVVSSAFCFWMGNASANRSNPTECKPACEAKACEPQKLEITLKTEGTIGVTGSIPVSGSVAVNGEVSGAVKVSADNEAAMTEWRTAMAEWEAKQPKPKVCK